VAVNHLIVSFILVEFIALPDVGFVLVMLVAGNSVLSPHTKDKEGILHQIVIVEHCG
jgi:hypothetical protein